MRSDGALVAEDRARQAHSRAYETADAQYGSRNVGFFTDAGVGPEDRIHYAGVRLDPHPASEYRVGTNLGVFAHLGLGAHERRPEQASAGMDRSSPVHDDPSRVGASHPRDSNLAVKGVVVRLAVTVEHSDIGEISPVSVRGNPAARGYHGREDLVLQRAAPLVRQELEDLRIHHVGADTDLARRGNARLFDEVDNPGRLAVLAACGPDHTVLRRVRYRAEGKGERGTRRFMGPDQRSYVEVGKRVAVETDEWFGKQGPYVSDSSSGAERLRLYRVAERDPERISVTEGGLDPPGQRGEAQDDIGDTRLAEQLELRDEERPREERDNGLRTAESKGAEPQRLSPNQNDRLHRTAGQGTRWQSSPASGWRVPRPRLIASVHRATGAESIFERVPEVSVANRLTLVRMLLTPFVAVALLASFPGWQLVSATLVAGAALTDLLDGHIARRRNQITALGTLLDPIADKFFISTIFICLVDRGLCPAWVAIVIVGREFAVTALRMVALQRGASVPVSLLGKIKMHAQVYAALLVLLGALYPALAPFGVAGLWAAAVLTAWSGFSYFLGARRVALSG